MSNHHPSRRRILQGLGAGSALLVLNPAPALALGSGRARAGLRRYRLSARPSSHLLGGNEVATWTFDGSLPGPLLRAQVGDRVVVELVNELDRPTTIHWHGVEVPATADGSSISQEPVPPGGTYTYEFDALRPGLFWYHPHIDTNEQVERGLYGALLIEDRTERDLLGITPANEHVLVLDDVLVEGGAIAPPFPADPLDNAVTHFNGRIGNLLLVNGDHQPTIRVRNGEPQRLRLVNVSNSRFMRLELGDGPAWRIGGDGGLLEAPLPVGPIRPVPGGHGGHHGGPRGALLPEMSGGILLTPGERADVVWVPTGARGSTVNLTWHDWPRGDHGAEYAPDGSIRIVHDPLDGMKPSAVLARFELIGQPAPRGSDYAPPPVLRSIPRLTPSGDPIQLTMGHGPPDDQGEVTFFLQRDAGGPKPFPTLTPDDVATVSPGEVRLIEVTNLTMGAHNFHLHGFFFQHLETELVDLDEPANNRVAPAASIEDKDTILVPGRPGAPMRSRTIVRLAAFFDDTGREGQVDAWGKTPSSGRSGGWLMHCHLLEHSNSGMMSFVQVVS